VTNYHVVRKNSPRVFTLDGREYAAEILGWDKWNDLALLQVAASRPLVPILRADSRRLRVGQFALAVGHPWGQIGSVSAGIITSFGRIQIRGQQQALDLVRTDARLAPGNSGGPLLNAKGQMIGINTMIMGGDLGVAIPTHIVDEFVAQKIGRDM
jgi:serine protease Do